MDPAIMVALRLAKEGIATPQQVLEMPTDLVLDALEYVGFLADYEFTLGELNKSEQ